VRWIPNIKVSGRISKRAVYLALGIDREGEKQLLGLWIGEAEGAKFWLRILTELKNRGLNDILIACCDGLTGFPEAIEAVYPQAQVQLCIVHLMRNCLNYIPGQDKKAVAADLKPIYQGISIEEAETALDAFSQKWDKLYPVISQIWLRHWEYIIPIFDYPMEIRRVIYTTNAIESLNRSFRKIIKTKAVFPDLNHSQIWCSLESRKCTPHSSPSLRLSQSLSSACSSLISGQMHYLIWDAPIAIAQFSQTVYP